MGNTIKLTNAPMQRLTAENGKNIPIGGYTFTPAVSAEGVISWTNDGNLENPTPVNIKGVKGDKGDRGLSGVYVGTGNMPDGYNVQIDPSGTTTEMDELQRNLVDLKNDNYFKFECQVYKNVTGWKLIDNGLCVQDKNYNLIKYKVEEGVLYSIDGAVSFQFQNAENVPSTGKPNRVGKTYFMDNVLFAPSGSTFLIVIAELNTTPKVSVCTKNCNYYPLWNNEIGGIYISDDKQKVCINKNGFLIKFDDVMYYVAPIDRISNYEFVGEKWNVYALCVDTTKLKYLYSRNNPDEVLTIVSMAGSEHTFNAKRYIPIAVWYKTYWEFYGIFKYFEQNYSNYEIDAKINGIVDKRGLVNPNICMFNLCSHRGDASKTNNTIDAFESAYQLGYKVIECDLRFTSDGHCVIFHDAAVDGTAISSMDLTTIQSNYSYIPTLTDVLLWAKKRQCVVELDCATRVSQRDMLYVYDKCVKYNMQNSVIITAYENELMYLINSNRCDTNVAVSLANGVPSNDKIDAISDNIKRFNTRFVSINKAHLTNDIVSYAHALNFNVQTWTVTSESEARQLYLTGVDLILCDASSVWEL